MSQRIILTGATGLIGEGVLLTCLAQPDVEVVLSVSRRPSGYTHPKLRELLVPDFFDLKGIEDELLGYTSCFFCAGISSAGLNEADYTHITHDLTLHVAQTLSRINPDLLFIYVSGASTNAQSSLMWARVKGHTENDLLQLPFRQSYMFRPGAMVPVAGQKNVRTRYVIMGWLATRLRGVFPNHICTLHEVGLAMLHTAQRGADRPVLEVKDIVRQAR